MRINLKVDFRGKITRENYYKAGEYGPGEMPEGHMLALVAAGHADEIIEKPVRTVPSEPIEIDVPKVKRGRK